MGSTGFRCDVCKVRCPYREHLLEKNKESTCVVPLQRDMSLDTGKNIRLLSEETLEQASTEMLALILDTIANEPNKEKRNRLGMRAYELLNDAKRSWYPATQKNLNVNANIFESQLKQFFDTFNKQQEKEKGIVIVADKGVEVECVDRES